MKLEDINNRNLPSVNKLISVLKYLNIGATLDVPELGELAIAETNSGGFQFVLILKSYTSHKEDPICTHVVGVDFDVVINAIEKHITDEDILMMGANTVLNTYKKS